MTETAGAQAIGERITGISSMATRRVLGELAAAYERQSGQRVVVESVGGVDAVRRIEAGEAFDFVVLAAEAIDKLAATGRIDPDTRFDIARSRVAIAVPAGARRPDLTSGQAVRDAVLAARSIGYSTGPSGRHLARLFARWGIADTIATRLVEAPPGVPVGTLVARADVEMGFQQLSELIDLPGIDVVGTLPLEIQEITVFSGAACVASARRAAAKALLSFCTSPAANAAKHRHGMEP
jgi:molybdate transport system substrate-binding protein